MSLTKPILYNIPAFDANNEQVFQFNVVGGDQVVANKLTIVRQSDSVVVYEEKEESLILQHTVHTPNNLVNGTYYSAYITTFDINDRQSAQSDEIQFYCYTTPTFQFYNIPTTNFINESFYKFEVRYNQAQGEELNTYQFNLYDAQGVLLKTSNIQYAGSGQSFPLSLFYQFDGFLNNSYYIIQATGETAEGTLVETEKTNIYIKYNSSEAINDIELSNNCKDGYILIKSNLNRITSKLEIEPAVYVNNKKGLDLTNNTLVYTNSSSYPENFTASLWGQNFVRGRNIVKLDDVTGNQYIAIQIHKNSQGQYYADLKDKDDNILAKSNFITMWDDVDFNKLHIWLRKINDDYELILTNVSGDQPDNHNALLNRCILGWMQLGHNMNDIITT